METKKPFITLSNYKACIDSVIEDLKGAREQGVNLGQMKFTMEISEKLLAIVSDNMGLRIERENDGDTADKSTT